MFEKRQPKKSEDEEEDVYPMMRVGLREFGVERAVGIPVAQW